MTESKGFDHSTLALAGRPGGRAAGSRRNPGASEHPADPYTKRLMDDVPKLHRDPERRPGRDAAAASTVRVTGIPRPLTSLNRHTAGGNVTNAAKVWHRHEIVLRRVTLKRP
jgi:hypothetical protein